mmetsp:Transcript_16118/g.62862  ORF Transcript_16118/g.62862 Transcript_16118/m.62862 type:complete len:608 (-) Transcript_16118:38-1861(-)
MYETMTETPASTLQEVMDEEFARKLQEELNSGGFEAHMPLESVTMKSMASSGEAESPHEEIDEDLLLALRLQEEFNQEYNDAVTSRYERGSGNQGQSKVTVNYASHLVEDLDRHAKAEASEPVRFSAADCDWEEEDYDEDYDDYEEYEEYAPVQSNKAFAKPQGRQEAEKMVTKHDKEMCGERNVRALDGNLSLRAGDISGASQSIPTPVFNAITQHAKAAETRRVRARGKEDRETREQVMDPQTRIILFKMINHERFNQVTGIISGGKEANVYKAIRSEEETGENAYCAVKIFKTTLNEFKNRDSYIKGDIRFGGKLNKHNPRKFIKVWCEKEEENLKRMRAHGIPCPEPLERKKHVLVMSFIGNQKTGVAAPQLKQVAGSLSSLRLRELYLQCIKQMRCLFSDCRLVHGDLSEYNMLYEKGTLYFIDVAQAVEYEHPNSLDFLRRDVANVTQFFSRCGLKSIMSIRELFSYITDRNITADNEEKYLEEMQHKCRNRAGPDTEDDAVFLAAHIPRCLAQIGEETAIQEIEAARLGDVQDVFHQQLTGMLKDLSGASHEPVMVDADSADFAPGEQLDKAAGKALRKEHKKRVKAEQRARRAARSAGE